MKSKNIVFRLKKCCGALLGVALFLMVGTILRAQCPGSAATPFDVARGGLLGSNNAIVSSLPGSVYAQDGGWDNTGVLNIQGDFYINGDMHLSGGSGFNVLTGGRLFIYGNAFIDSNAILSVNTGGNVYFYGDQWTAKQGAIINNASGPGTVSYIMPRPAVGSNDGISGSNRYPSNATADTTTANATQYMDGGNVDMAVNIAHHNANNISLCNLDNSATANSGDTRLSDTITFYATNGDVILNGNNFIFSSTGNYAYSAINNYAAYFVTNGTGYVSKIGLANNAIFNFPVGQAESDYTPASITNASGNINNYNVQVKAYANTAAVISAPTEGMDRAWQISADAGGAANICLVHNSVSNAAGVGTDGSAFTNSTAFATQQTTPGVWSTGTQTDGGTPVSTHCANFTIPNTTTAANSYFTKSSDPITPLPIVLKEFNGVITNCVAHLAWTTTSDIDNNAFEIQYRTDGNRFATIGNLKSNRGTTGASYSFTYSDISATNNYFRLQIMGVDSRITYSPILMLNADCNAKAAITIAPNPVKDAFTIKELKEGNQIIIVNTNGQKMMDILAQNSSSKIDTHSWSSGLYTVIIMDNGKILKTEKIIKY